MFDDARKISQKFADAREAWVVASDTYGEGSPEEMLAYDEYLEALSDYTEMMSELEDIKNRIDEMLG